MRIVIEVPEGESASDTVAEVLRLLDDGFTSGVNPNWEIEEGDT